MPVDQCQVRQDSDASACSRQVVGAFLSFTLREIIEKFSDALTELTVRKPSD